MVLKVKIESFLTDGDKREQQGTKRTIEINSNVIWAAELLFINLLLSKTKLHF